MQPLPRREEKHFSAFMKNREARKCSVLQLVCFLFAIFVLGDMVLFWNHGGFQDSKTHSKERGSATKIKSAQQKHKLHKPWLCSVVLVLMLGCKQHLLRMLGCKQCRLLRRPQWGLKLSQLQGERSRVMLKHATCATKSMKRIAMKTMCWVARLHKDFQFVCDPLMFHVEKHVDIIEMKNQRAKVTLFLWPPLFVGEAGRTNRSDTSWNINRWKSRTSKKDWQSFPRVKRPMDTSTFGKSVARKKNVACTQLVNLYEFF